MTTYDAVMAGMIIAGMVWGAWRGITWQVASIASLVLGYVTAQPMSARLAPHFPGEPVVARALAMLAVYVGVSGGVFFIAWLIRATLRQFKFEAFDRHLGMVLGGLEGALLGIVGTLFVVSLAPQTRSAIFESPAGKVVGTVMATLGPVLPSEARKVLSPFLDGHDTAIGAIDADPSLPEPVPFPVPRTRAAAPAPAPVAARPAGNPPVAAARQPIRDAATRPATASFEDILREGQSRLGQAITEGAARGVERAARGLADGQPTQSR